MPSVINLKNDVNDMPQVPHKNHKNLCFRSIEIVEESRG